MKRNFLIALAVVGVVGIGGALAASPTSALTIEELQAQVQELVAQIRALGGQPAFTQSPSTVAIDPVNPAGNLRHRICAILNRNLSQGARGDDVVSLQEFLHTEGHLSANATGYFGPLTAQAVARWQASQGVSSVGAVGPISRERIRVWCGGGGWTNQGRFSASPTRGNAPLSVNFTYQGGEESGQYYIEFGDGQGQLMDTRQIYCIRAPCISPSVASHTYTSLGTYTATVSRYIACLYTDPRCLMAQPPPLAETSIVVTDGSGSNNRPPVISGFSGPTTLSLDQTGTWTIEASDPENGSLSYSVRWGDENFLAAPASSAMREAFVQTTTFTHTYNASGTYTITVVVRDSAGAEARTTTSVRVGGAVSYCTADAMQCPDGTWVGRSGSNCQFVCP